MIRYLSPIEPPEGLAERILLHIRQFRRRVLIARTTALISLSIASLGVFIEAIFYSGKESYISGFSEYIHLFFTDSDVVLLSWKETVGALLESFPTTGFIAMTLALLLFCASGIIAVRNIKTIRTLALN